ncbi:Hypothetical predicted protein, partial [Paramuricea clavata]
EKEEINHRNTKALQLSSQRQITQMLELKTDIRSNKMLHQLQQKKTYHRKFEARFQLSTQP